MINQDFVVVDDFPVSPVDNVLMMLGEFTL